MDYIVIKNYERYQHYLTRNISAWIKVYYAFLDDYKISGLRDAERWVFVGLLLLAGKTQNRIPADFGYIAEKISHKEDRKNIENIVKKLKSIDIVYTLSIKPSLVVGGGEKRREEKRRNNICRADRATAGPDLIPKTEQQVSEVMAGEAITYLNVKAGRHFTSKPGVLKHLRARIKEGASIENLKMVIDFKVWDWQDKYKNKQTGEITIPEGMKDMREYLRPETLFNSEKYYSYLEAAVRSNLERQYRARIRQDCAGQGLNKQAEDDKVRELARTESVILIEGLQKRYGDAWWRHLADEVNKGGGA